MATCLLSYLSGCLAGAPASGPEAGQRSQGKGLMKEDITDYHRKELMCHLCHCDIGQLPSSCSLALGSTELLLSLAKGPYLPQTRHTRPSASASAALILPRHSLLKPTQNLASLLEQCGLAGQVHQM